MKTKRVLMTLALCLVLGACSKGKKTAGKSYKIGVNQLMEHKALDDVREGFQEELKNLGVSFELDYKNAQGDVSSNSNIIASKFAQDKVDLRSRDERGAGRSVSLLGRVLDPAGAPSKIGRASCRERV